MKDAKKFCAYESLNSRQRRRRRLRHQRRRLAGNASSFLPQKNRYILWDRGSSRSCPTHFQFKIQSCCSYLLDIGWPSRAYFRLALVAISCRVVYANRTHDFQFSLLRATVSPFDASECTLHTAHCTLFRH